MNCGQVEDLLSAYLDDQLTANEHQSVNAHLISCPHCESILADYRRFDALLAQLPRVTPRPDLRNRILATAGPFVGDSKQQSPDSHSNSLQSTPQLLPVKHLFPKQPALESLQTHTKLTFPFQPLFKHCSRRNILGMQITLILILLLLTNSIRLLLTHYSWQKHS